MKIQDPPVFGRLINPIPTRADYAHHITQVLLSGPHRFLDLKYVHWELEFMKVYGEHCNEVLSFGAKPKYAPKYKLH